MSRRAWAWIAWGVTVAVLGVAAVLAPANAPLGQGAFDRFLIPLQSLAFGCVGLLVSLRRRDNPVGWLFQIVGLFAAAYAFTYQYELYALVTRPGELPAGKAFAWLQAWIYVPALVTCFTFLPLLFPDGRLPSQRWRPVLVLNVCALVGVCLADAFEPGRITNTPIQNPVGLQGPVYELISLAVPLLMFPATVLSVSALIARWRRSHGEESQQLKVFAFGASLLPATVLTWVVTGLLGIEGSALEPILSSAAFLVLPVAAGVAILRYRLYDIDRIINRTVVYAIVTGAALAVYAGTVFVVGTVVVGSSDNFTVAVATLAAAAVFRPALRRVQAFVDRRFYRHKYDAQHTIDAFGARLREETDLDELTGDLVGVVRTTMQPEHVSVWLRTQETGS
jgi:hypothetical protein